MKMDCIALARCTHTRRRTPWTNRMKMDCIALARCTHPRAPPPAPNPKKLDCIPVAPSAPPPTHSPHPHHPPPPAWTNRMKMDCIALARCTRLRNETPASRSIRAVGWPGGVSLHACAPAPDPVKRTLLPELLAPQGLGKVRFTEPHRPWAMST